METCVLLPQACCLLWINFYILINFNDITCVNLMEVYTKTTLKEGKKKVNKTYRERPAVKYRVNTQWLQFNHYKVIKLLSWLRALAVQNFLSLLTPDLSQVHTCLFLFINLIHFSRLPFYDI